MKLILGDNEYDVWDSVNYATLGALDDLQEQSSTPTFDGVTDPYIRSAFVRAAELVAEGTPLRGQKDFRRALMGVVFLAKHRADENPTWVEVRKIQYSDAKLRLEEKELADEAPKESGAAESPEQT